MPIAISPGLKPISEHPQSYNNSPAYSLFPILESPKFQDSNVRRSPSPFATAALTVSPETVFKVTRFANELWQSCRAAKGHFDRIGKEVFTMKTVTELVALELKDKQPPISRVDDGRRGNMYYKQLEMLIENCKQALQDVDACLKKHEKMYMTQRLAWTWKGEEEVSNLVADLSSFGTQLDSFVNMSEFGELHGGVGRLEQLLDRNGGNDSFAVDTMMTELAETWLSIQNAAKYEEVIASYALEASKTVKASGGRGVKAKALSSGTLDVPGFGPRQRIARAKSTDAAATAVTKTSRYAQLPGNKNGKHMLECWLIQFKPGNVLSLSEKELQPRGQCQLEEMAKAVPSIESLPTQG